MQNIKKYFMTLALLLMAVTGAWADDQSESFTTVNTESAGAMTCTGEHFTISGQKADTDGLWIGNAGGGDKTVTISSRNGENITKIEAVLSYVQDWGDTKLATTSGEVTGTYQVGQTITISSVNATTVTLSSPDSNFKLIQFNSWTIYYGDAPTPFPITWDATNKTTGFNLPAGNVFMTVEYYPTAELTAAPAAKSNIKATTTDAIVEAGTVAKIGQTENAQGTLMYYAVQSETAPDAPDYDNKGWSDKVPTAADFNEGNVYVWYYVKGADGDETSTFNDGAITKLGESGYVTLAAPPTYAITLKEDTEEFDKWDISPAEAAAGSPVTATYSGSRKVKSVKAVKKADNAYLKWDTDQKKLVATDIPTTANKVQNSNENIEWAGTYVVEGEVTINGKIYLTGNVDLIIKDGAKLTANRINSPYNDKKNLSIYGQAQMTGELVINSTSYAIDYLSTLSVHSAKVTANSANSTSPSSGGIFAVNTINVYGGLLDAKYTGSDGYGIYLNGGGNMNIYGGEVKAASNGTSANSYGIMASTYDSAITVTVYGGKLWAESPGNTVFNTTKTTFAKGAGFTGKIETSGDGSSWTEYTSDGTPDTKYVRVGY